MKRLKHKIIYGKSEIELKQFGNNTFDSCVTDPPYNLTSITRPLLDQTKNGSYGKEVPFSRVQSRMGGFMGKEWDGTGISFNAKLWEEVYRILKPGAHILVFGGTRTYHRMACAVEDAGFEVRDMIEWIYGSGFPKSLDISKSLDKMNGIWRGTSRGIISEINSMSAPNYERLDKGEPITKEAIQWNGWGTGLKPAHEPILLARKPINERNIAMNVLKWETGGINVDGCRISHLNEEDLKQSSRPNWKSHNLKSTSKVHHAGAMTGGIKYMHVEPHIKGRFPSKLILECCCEDDELVEVNDPTHPGKCKNITNPNSIFGIGTGEINKDRVISEKGKKCLIHTNPECVCRMLDEQSGVISASKRENVENVEYNANQAINFYGKFTKMRGYYGNGGASRFFYQAKASQAERWFYCTICKQAYPMKERDVHIHNAPEKTKYQHLEFHPTQKPEKLISYLVRLVTPPKGTVLDPFMGTGATLVAAEREGFNSVGIDSSFEYCRIAEQRLKNEAEQLRIDREQSMIERVGF